MLISFISYKTDFLLSITSHFAAPLEPIMLTLSDWKLQIGG